MVITEIILIIFFVAEDGEAHIVSKNKTWSSDHQLLIAKFRLKLEKVGKNTRPFRYDLNQIPYDYTVEVTNKFKEIDLVDTVPEELWTEVHNIEQEVVTKIISKKKKRKKANGCLRRPYK